MNKIVNPRDILLRPVISEKSLRLADDGKYTFIVAPGSHKTQIRQAVEATFSVTVTVVLPAVATALLPATMDEFVGVTTA